MVASITTARTESVQTKKFTSASSMNTKLCHHSELTAVNTSHVCVMIS